MGAGVLEFDGANTYTGATALIGGTLLINGSGTSNITASNSGSTWRRRQHGWLGDDEHRHGTRPGRTGSVNNGIGTLNVNSLLMNAGSSFSVAVGTSVASTTFVPATSGSFNLNFNGQTTGNISVAGLTASGLETILQGLTSISANNVIVNSNT